MRFFYRYQDREKGIVEGEVAAPSQSDAYSVLRKSGIRPMQVWPAPGLANRLASLGKRGWSIVALCALCLVLGAVILVGRSPRDRRADDFLADTTRRQVIGDTAIIEKGILDGWSDVFVHEGERFLAGFAVPGVPVKVRNTTEGEIRAALERQILSTPDDSLEARQIKAMVEGMKQELREFLADGGTIVGYGQCLVRRQEEEIAHHNRAKDEIDALAKTANREALRARWEEVNDRLRKMGIKLIPWPEEE